MKVESMSVNPHMGMEAQDSDKLISAKPAPKRAQLKPIALVLLLLTLLGAQSSTA